MAKDYAWSFPNILTLTGWVTWAPGGGMRWRRGGSAAAA